ncbi:HDOD domain-containing protein [Novipirellula caenicola]|uniref:Sensor histidine kinase RcsC n=1 Tax=Novipirellula caenicola TaxID=1536901 RepID=A0ABP9VWX0_9BACT
MSEQKPKRLAIVVDDEAIARKMLMFALQHEGFQCDQASDGHEAMQKITSGDYQLVVTDLAMPHKNGHALAVELLKLEKRPTIAIHTSVVEPRIVKDLMNRGVDDIVYKPTHYAAFAAKMVALVERRNRSGTTDMMVATDEASSGTLAGLAGAADEGERNRMSRRQAKTVKPLTARSVNTLGGESLPFSDGVIEACRLACNPNSEVHDISAAIRREPGLSAELTRLGNSSFYNRSGSNLRLEEVVVRIGRRHVGELALALNASSSIREMAVTSMNVPLAWQRSLAARAAAKILISLRKNSSSNAGILLSAAMHSLGRLVLAKAFPDDMATMIQHANDSGEALTVLEQRALSATQSEMLARLLNKCQIPKDIIGPLQYIDKSYRQLEDLDPADREDAELVKVAVLIGWLAVGHWEPWDLVEIPPVSVLRQHGCRPVSELVKRTREALLEMMAEFGDSGGLCESSSDQTPCLYHCVGERDWDILQWMLPAVGFTPAETDSQENAAMVINAMDVTRRQFAKHPAAREPRRGVMLVRSGQAVRPSAHRAVHTFPCSVASLAKAISANRFVQNEPSLEPVGHTRGAAADVTASDFTASDVTAAGDAAPVPNA